LMLFGLLLMFLAPGLGARLGRRHTA